MDSYILLAVTNETHRNKRFILKTRLVLSWTYPMILKLGNMTATLPSPLLPPTLFCATRKQHASNEQGLHVEISGQQYEMRRHLPKNGKMSIRCCCWDQTLGKTFKKKHPCLKRQFMKPVGHEAWGRNKILAIYIISQWLPSLLWVPIAIPRQLASINQLHRLHLSSTKPQPSPLNDNKMMMTQLWWQNPWSNNPPAPPPKKKTYKIKHENTSHAKKLRLPTETGHTCTFNSFRPCWIFSANAFCQTQNGRQRRNNDQSQTKLVGEMLRPVSGKWGNTLGPQQPMEKWGFYTPKLWLITVITPKNKGNVGSHGIYCIVMKDTSCLPRV